jgi:hypothetical protein
MQIVRVKWRDAHNYNGWTRPSNVEGGYTVDICESVGWLIDHNADRLIIALDTDLNGNFGSVGVIPAEAVVEYEVVRDG